MQETTDKPTQTPVREINGRPLDEWLRAQYVERGYSDREIAQAMGVTRQAVQQWRALYGISRPEKPPLELTA